MRARVYSNGGISTGGFTFNGGQLTGALILAGNPSDPLEAAAKQYVDSSLVNLNASNLTSGILPAGRLPVFTGDIVKPAGSSSINIAPIGITAGDYVKPTVDAKGRVTAGGVITEADLPNISWNKVSTGKPTTVEGYGITGALTTAGGTLSGFLTFNGSITGTMQAVTKQYVDVTLSSSTGIAIGDIIRKPYGTTPSGFLKCNGALVDKTTYNALYATIGDRFSKQQRYTSGCPWQQQYNINETQSTDITGWTTYTNLPAPMYTLKSIVTKNRVHLLGGYIGSGYASTVYTAPINADGTLGAWVASGNLPGILGHSSIVVTKNRIHLLGGWVTNVVYTASINNDGTLGAWTTGISLPIAARDASVIVTNNRVYFLGGGNTTDTFSTIYSAFINSDGTLGTWVASGNLPINLAGSQVVITKNRAYLCGGWNAAGALSSVYTAPINSDGTLGGWTTSLSLPGQLAQSQAIVTKDRVYLLGGWNGTYSVSNVYTAPINQDGTLGTWSIGTPIPGALGASSTVITKNHVYLIGGYTTEAVSTVYSAIISGGLNDYSAYYSEDTTNYMTPGSGRPWQQQYQINTTQSGDITGWSATTSLPGVTSHSSPIVTKNRVYLFGGITAPNVTTSAVYTAPINSDGTLGTWTTGTFLPASLGAMSTIVTKNRVYLLGGWTGTASVSTVYTAPINSDGTLGVWVSGNSLPGNLYNSHAIITKNRVYLLGGNNGTEVVSTVYTALINIDGTLGTWSTGTSLPVASYGAHVIVTKNRVYLLGGHNGTTYVSTVYTATINSDGGLGPWTSAASLPSLVYLGGLFITSNRVYLFGGYNGTGTSTIVYTTNINADGTLGTWTVGTSLPIPLYAPSTIVTSGKVYLLGGSNTAYLNTVYTAPILGGMNDYSSYYNGTIVPVEPVDQTNLFALPDLTQSEKFDTVSYIKY